jgi:hypothetical protein
MKRSITLILLVISINLFGQSPFQTKIRTLFTKVDNSEMYNNKLWELTKSTDIDNPTVYAYKCLYFIMNAKYVFWVKDKMTNFRLGRDKLEKAIEKYPQNIDLRLVRYAVQKNAPRFLKYGSNTKEDRKVLADYTKSNKTDPVLNDLVEGVLAKFP